MITDLVIPESVTHIGAYVFSCCDGLKSVIIPESVTSIGEYAFHDCNGLKSVVIPETATSIADKAFNWIDFIVIYGYEGSEAEDFAWRERLEFVKLARKTDRATGIIISDIPEEFRVSITALSGSDAAKAAKGLEGIKNVYNITTSEDGRQVYLENIVKIQIPCSRSGIKVFRKEDDGTFTDMGAVYRNGVLTFCTDQLGIFALAEKKTPTEPSATAICGDADGDGNVTILDATRVQRWLAKLCDMNGKAYTGAALTAAEVKAADADGDAHVTILDATAIQRYLACFGNTHAIGETRTGIPVPEAG